LNNIISSGKFELHLLGYTAGAREIVCEILKEKEPQIGGV